MHWIRRQCESGFAYGVFTAAAATTASETQAAAVVAAAVAEPTPTEARVSAIELGQDTSGNDVNEEGNREYQPISWIIAYK